MLYLNNSEMCRRLDIRAGQGARELQCQVVDGEKRKLREEKAERE
jgi:hypothetical protein